jgi:hypothetical protein
VQILSALAQEVHGFHLRLSNNAASTANHPTVYDIGVDPAGGTSYSPIINNILAGNAGAITNTGGGHVFYFPFRIRAGSTVAARASDANATPLATRVGIRAFGQPSAGWLYPDGQYSETLGVSGTAGTSFTPGNVADGSFVLLGTTTREMWWWQLSYQIANTTITAEYTYIELFYGDASNKVPILKRYHGGTTGETCGTIADASLLFVESYCRVPAGSNIYVRGRCNNAPDTGYQAAAHGIGG